ncbi:MAG: site-specific DNA-methyltransferase [Planctomycetes bacterium]|jgi:DNA modification methylase|nr:site-specific DNA-methyltransferase [Planctomycetota bacterium]
MPPRKRPTPILPKLPTCTAYTTSNGAMLVGESEIVLSRPELRALKGKVQLIFTSPPFPLNHKKKYGNLRGGDYVMWLAKFGPIMRELLKPDGSIVIELGNSWEEGHPTMSTLPMRALLYFQEQNFLHLCQEFICHNPARLPSPAEWVTVRRIRLKDSYTRLWWLSPDRYPKANNRNVLKPYSAAQTKLIESGKFNTGRRPSQFVIAEKKFAKNNGGSISPNVLSISNTRSRDGYQEYCRTNDIEFHPARMPIELPKFFINFLTSPGDIVLDPFGGSNTTGAAADELGRYWVTVEPNESYVRGSMGRFDAKQLQRYSGRLSGKASRR